MLYFNTIFTNMSCILSLYIYLKIVAKICGYNGILYGNKSNCWMTLIYENRDYDVSKNYTSICLKPHLYIFMFNKNIIL